MKFFDHVQYFLNVVKYFWPCSNMQIYKVKYHFWPRSKNFERVQKILNTVKKIWAWSKYFWTSRWNRHYWRNSFGWSTCSSKSSNWKKPERSIITCKRCLFCVRILMPTWFLQSKILPVLNRIFHTVECETSNHHHWGIPLRKTCVTEKDKNMHPIFL